MNALVIAPGNTIVIAEVIVPQPAANEIRIRVHNIALNPVDSPLYRIEAAAPGRVVGSDVAGVVDKVGEGVTQWKVGDKAAGLLQGATSTNPRPGGFAEYAILEADLAIHVPASVPLEQAAAFPLCSLTAAQALFIRLGINPPFPNPVLAVNSNHPPADAPTILIYSASTVIGLFAIELLKATCTPSGKPYRIFATANPKHHAKLLANGVEAVFDYRSETWIEEVRRASGGISLAFDCISEDDSTAQISQTFVESGGTIAVVRKAWNRDGIREGVTPVLSVVWLGLGHEIFYSDTMMPANPSWRAFSVEFFKFLSVGSPTDSPRFPIDPIAIRLMPGGLDRIVPDGFTLLGAGVKRRNEGGTEPWMSPISGEKLVYQITGK